MGIKLFYILLYLCEIIQIDPRYLGLQTEMRFRTNLQLSYQTRIAL